jgi:4a-hydroxytetrahydrobiopterin dehydratase
MAQKFDLDEITARVESLNGWELQGEAISKNYHFKNFAEALAFVNKVGALAEAANHHPDIFLSFGMAVITLCTHEIEGLDEGGLTEKDFDLAKKIEAL